MTNRPRVAILGTRGYPSHYGGFETAVRWLAPYLCDAGWDVTVYGRTDLPAGGDPRVRTIRTKGIEKRSLSTLTYGLTSFLHARRSDYDVLLIMNVANGLWLPLVARTPTVLNVDGLEWLREKWGFFARMMFKLGARMTARHATELVYDARAIESYWSENFGRDGTFIPYGGDPSSPRSSRSEDRDPGSYVLFVARFVPENTVGAFMDAAEMLAAQHRVVIVGSSGYGGELEERALWLAENYPSIEWLGHVHDEGELNALWRNAGVYFHGHSVGGTNPALVQAMALGVPTVARDTVFNREVLAEAGIFVPADAETISRELSALLADPARRRELSKMAAERAREHYSWAAVCGAYETLLSISAAPRVD